MSGERGERSEMVEAAGRAPGLPPQLAPVRADGKRMRSDTDVVAEFLDGSRAAFGELYDRYCDRIHDFCTSMLRDRHEAEDATQDTFVIAYNRLGDLRDPARVGSWLFSIARRDCLNRLRRRARDVPTDDLVIEDSDPTPEAEAADADLSVRQGLDGADLAAALGVKRQNAYALASNVRQRFEKSLGALMVARVGRRDCPDLDALLAGWDGTLDPLVRKRIARHVDDCDTCEGCRKRTASPLALLGAVPLFAAPFALRQRVAEATELPLSGTAAETEAERGRDGFPKSDATGLSAKVALTAGAACIAVVAVVVCVLVFVVGGDSDIEAAERDAADTTAPAPTSGPPATVEPPTTASVETYCDVAAELVAAIGTSGPAAPTPAAFEEYFTTALAYFARLAPLAPPAIEGDVKALRDGYGALVAEGSAAEWSPATLAGAGAEVANLEAANERVEADFVARCGID